MSDIEKILAIADKKIEKADTPEKIQDLIDTYKEVLKIDPENYKALWSLGRYYVVITFDIDDKVLLRKYCLAAIHYCERTIYSNPVFRSTSMNGKQFWEVIDVLTQREMPPLYYWYAATGIIFKECLNMMEKLRRLNWGIRLKKVMTRMMELDPEWAGGHPYLAMAIYYSNIPGFMGGGLKKAEKYFHKTVEAGPNWIYTKWARANYFHTRMKDKQSFIEDMEWVIAQDPHKADSPYPANVYFQNSAREMLANLDTFFH